LARVINQNILPSAAYANDIQLGQVIKGWDEGLLEMGVGEKRKLTIQPALGYGSRSMGAAIPANSVLSKNQRYIL